MHTLNENILKHTFNLDGTNALVKGLQKILNHLKKMTLKGKKHMFPDVRKPTTLVNWLAGFDSV